MKGQRGFTLLEMIVATTIMGIAVAGLMSGISSSTRNAARLRDYDRVVQLARLRMNGLLADPRVPLNAPQDGVFDPAITGGLECGWRAQVSVAEKMPFPAAGDYVLDRIQLEIWWMSGGQRRTFPLEGYRRRTLRPEDIEAPR
ncbi:MAG: type II secretion system protein [Candidatus Solibacter sp.]|nr:type II secretion system protein [Candidatus Solibacter sp.]